MDYDSLRSIPKLIRGEDDLPFDEYLEALRVQEQVYEDAKLCRSLQKAAIDDANILEEEAKLEEQEVSDHRRAVELDASPESDGEAMDDEAAEPQDDQAVEPSKTDSVADQDKVTHDQFLAKLLRKHVTPEAAAEFLSKREAATGNNGSQPTYECLACSDQMRAYEVARLQCGHNYCHRCLDRLYSEASKDKSLFPPRCCAGTIPDDVAQLLLSDNTAAIFNAKVPELSATNPIYCHVNTCSTFIVDEAIEESAVAECPKCGAEVCVDCGQGWHEDACAPDESYDALMNLAEEEGWKRCPDCNSLIERTFGCNHMT